VSTAERTEPATAAELSEGYERRWWVLATMIVCLLMVIMGNTILNVALPTLQRELSATQGELQWAIDSYILVFAGLLFSWGVVGDRIGRRKVLLAGLTIFAIGSVLAAFSGSAIELIVWRALMGVGGAAVQPATLPVNTNVFPPGERGRAIAVWAGAAGIAVAGGPLAGGLVLEHFWWGAVFLLGVPVAAVGVAGILLVVPESKDPAPGRLDVPGVLLSIAALGGLVYGIIRGGGGAGWTTPGVLGPLAGGAVLLALFIWWQRRTTHPALDITLFRNPAFSASAAALALNFFALQGATFYLVFYLQGVRDYSPLHSGAALIPTAIGMAVMAPPSSRLAERLGAKLVVASGFLLVAISFAGIIAPATEAIMAVVPREKAGAGAAVNNSVRQVGGALGVAILGSVMATAYAARLGDAVDGLPAESRDQARESIVATLGAVERAQGGDAEVARSAAGVVGPARDALVGAMHLTALGTAGAALVATTVVLLWMPGRSRAS
jgi:MFS family permease